MTFLPEYGADRQPVSDLTGGFTMISCMSDLVE